jgi:6-phosphogluconolactonase (cycloisomerase 2 family)
VLFVQTNAPNGGNAVRVLVAGKGGKFRSAGTFRTGQSGTGKDIPSDGTMVLTSDRRHLAVLDMGSSALTVFRVGKGRLVRTDRLGSGGRHPVSVAAGPDDRLVVLNAGGVPNLAGFKVRRKSGNLAPLRSLSAPLSQRKAGAYAVALSPNGKRAAVSYAKARGGRDLELFSVAGGRLKSSRVAAVGGGRPSPISFLRNDRILVGRMASSGPGVAVYAVGQGLRKISSIDGVLPCWVEVDGGGTLGWGASPTAVSAFAIGPGGKLGKPRLRRLPGRTYDLTLGEGGHRLYVLSERGGGVRVLAVNPRKLDVIGASPRLPRTSTGIVDLPNSIGGFPT